jgi:NADH-quinone oxidoreductase subunit L
VAAFHLDAVQRALIVRPVRGLSRTVRKIDESLVDGAVEGTGRATVGLGGLTGRAHAGAVPRALTAVLGGVLVLAAVVTVAVTR